MTGESFAVMLSLTLVVILVVFAISHSDLAMQFNASWAIAAATIGSLIVLICIAFEMYGVMRQLQWLNRLLSGQEETRLEFQGTLARLRHEAKRVSEQ